MPISTRDKSEHPGNTTGNGPGNGPGNATAAQRGASVTEIARQLGVSRQLVSKVLNGGRSSAGASDQTRRRVLKTARRLGYRPNAAARTIATGKCNAVGLVLSTHDSQSTVFGKMMRGIHDRLAADQMHLVTTFLDDARLTSDDAVPRILGEIMVDGLLINYTHAVPPRMVELIAQHRIPSVWINSKQKRNCIYINDFAAAHEATRRLLALGHRRVLFLNTTLSVDAKTGEAHYSHADRRAGYDKAMHEAGLEARVLTPSGWWQTDAISRARGLLSSPDRPSAVVAYSDLQADILMRAAETLGLTLGRDLSVICFSAAQNAVGPTVDTMLLPEAELGEAAVEQLLLAIAEPAAVLPPVALPMTYTAGETLGPPPPASA